MKFKWSINAEDQTGRATMGGILTVNTMAQLTEAINQVSADLRQAFNGEEDVRVETAMLVDPSISTEVKGGIKERMAARRARRESIGKPKGRRS
jgi:hypothetical protein